MNFLITGGCGYIGTQLTKHLLSKKNKVIVVDNCWFGNFHKKNKRPYENMQSVSSRNYYKF